MISVVAHRPEKVHPLDLRRPVPGVFSGTVSAAGSDEASVSFQTRPRWVGLTWRRSPVSLQTVLSPWSRPASGTLLGEPSGSPTPDEHRHPAPALPRDLGILDFKKSCTAKNRASGRYQDLSPWGAASSSARPAPPEPAFRCGIQNIAHAFSGTTSIAGRDDRRDSVTGKWRRAVVGTNSHRLRIRRGSSDRDAVLTLAASTPVPRRGAFEHLPGQSRDRKGAGNLEFQDRAVPARRD